MLETVTAFNPQEELTHLVSLHKWVTEFVGGTVTRYVTCARGEVCGGYRIDQSWHEARRKHSRRQRVMLRRA